MLLDEELGFDAAKYNGVPGIDEPVVVAGILASLVSWVNGGFSVFELRLAGDSRRFVHSARQGLLPEILYLRLDYEIEFTCRRVNEGVYLITSEDKIIRHEFPPIFSLEEDE